MLGEVMRKTEGILAGVRPDQRDFPTPDADWNVRQLENHIVGWAIHFAARESGQGEAGDPSSYQAGDDPAREFEPTIDPLVTALDGKLSAPADQSGEGGYPAPALITVLIAEYVLHGWDLATATHQPVPFTDEEAKASLAMRPLLTQEYRDQMFGPELPAPPNATPLQELLAFAGREPA